MSISRWKDSSGAVSIDVLGGEGDLSVELQDQTQLLKELGMVSAASSLERVRTSYVNQGKLGYDQAQLERWLTDFRHRLYDDLRGPQFIALVGAERALFEQETPLFGLDVNVKFPSLSAEISEAGKCLALGRSTAAAFHSIRILEGGIRAISRCLGIPDPTKGADRSWFNMLKAIETEMKKRWPNAADRFAGDGQIFEELHGALAAIQNPYRNATAHLDSNYSEAQARHLMEMSKGFLQRIAARIDESGSPPA